MAHDVFLSYSTKDKFAADAACAVLERNGIRVWIAPRDILPSDEWAEAIINAIKSAQLMVLVFSGNAIDSKPVRSEVERAFNKGLPVIPFRIENIQPSGSLELFLSAAHWLDAFTKPAEQHLDRLAGVVWRVIETKNGGVRPSAGADARAEKEQFRPEQANVASQTEAAIREGRQAKNSILSDTVGTQRRRVGSFAFGAAALASLVAVGGYFWRDGQRVGAGSRPVAPSIVAPAEPSSLAPPSAPAQEPAIPVAPTSASLTTLPLVSEPPVEPPRQTAPPDELKSTVVAPAPVAPRATPKVTSTKTKPRVMARAKPRSSAESLTTPKKCFTFNGEKFCE